MSQGPRVELDKARAIAQELVDSIRDHCDRIVIAGSIRRERPTCGDIDLVLITTPGRRQRVTDKMYRWGRLKLDGPKWKRIFHKETHIPIDVHFVAPPDDWGPVLVAKTGPTALRETVVEQLKVHGLDWNHGQIGEWLDRAETRWRHHPCPDEREVFKLAQLPYLPATRRDLFDALQPLSGSDPEWRRLKALGSPPSSEWVLGDGPGPQRDERAG